MKILQIPLTNDLPQIDVTTRNLPEITRQAWNALVKNNNPPYLFRYGNNLARLITGEGNNICIDNLDWKKLRYELARCAKFVILKKDGLKDDLPPTYACDDMLVEPTPPLPNLSRIVTAPIFSKNGKISYQTGYDSNTECYLHFNKEFAVPDVPTHPSQDHVKEARGNLEELLYDFPFTSDSEKAHAISLFLSPFIRDMIDGPIPLYIIEAPSPGTGKTLLVQVLTYPFIGKPIDAMSEGRNDEEMRKRITAKLMSYPTHIFIDNIRDKISSSSLASAITSGTWSDRRLGVSQTVRIPVALPNYMSWL